MAKLPIVMWGNPILKQKAKPIVAVDDSLRQLANNMFDTMAAENGVGLAANQVGVLERVFVVEIPQKVGPSFKAVLLNPEITQRSREKETQEEGCLSFPGIYGPVERHYRVVVEGLDLNWQPVKIEGEGLLARAIQHELDHLDGVVFVERMSMIHRTMLNKPLRELARSTKAGLAPHTPSRL